MEKPSPQKLRDVQSAFNKGIVASRDSINDLVIRQGGKAVTTLQSYWLHQLCPVCSHTFRIDDEVVVAKDGTVRHNMASLACVSERGGPGSFEETSPFFHGLYETWPPPQDVPIVLLETGHELLAGPRKGFQRHRCVVCGHTLRVHDQVIICPCSPDNPKCFTAIHRDPVHGLHCYQAWNPGANKQSHCPVTSRKLNE